MFGDEDWARINSAIAQMRSAPIYIDDTRRADADRGARARAPPEARARARPDRRRLPAAHAGAGHQGESRHRDLRDLALAQGAGEGAAGAGDRAVAAEPRRRAAHRQEAGDVGPARIGRHRAGQRPDHADLPRGGLRPGHAAQGHRRHHHRQAAQRPDRRGAADLPRQVHALREPRARVAYGDEP